MTPPKKVLCFFSHCGGALPILEHSLELMCLSEITAQTRQSENRGGGRPAGRDLRGQGFMRLTTPASPQQQIHYNNGLRSHQRANGGSGGAPRVDTEQSAHGCF